MQHIINLFKSFKFPEQHVVLASGIAAMLLFFLLLYLSWYFFHWTSRKYLHSRYFRLKNKKWHDAIKETNLLAAFGYFGAGFAAKFSLDFFFPVEHVLIHSMAAKLITAYFQFCFLIVVNNILSVIYYVNKHNPHIPIKGVIQFLRIFINFFGVLVMLAYFIGKEPTYFISALGVIMSVLMIVFKDTILGLTAGWQLSVNQMLDIGDWISVPKHNADGQVIDISLTTISVQNWDKTIISIPAYDLISGSFQNWRGMRQSGSRRIKRAVYIDVQSVKFADDNLLKRLSKIELLKEYLSQKEEDIKDYNSKHDTASHIVNGRALTNIGIFRIYCEKYIKSRPYLNTSFTTMVRQLAITEKGLPIEIYCFTATTDWVPYEGYQADIFDHILAVTKEFELSVFQNPSGSNFAALINGK